MTTTGETGDRRAFSPSALNRFLACEHRTYLDILERRGEMRGLRLPPDMSLLFERGDRHEDAVVPVARDHLDGERCGVRQSWLLRTARQSGSLA